MSIFRTLCVYGVLFAATLSAQAPVRVASAYEDTVRIALLWNQSFATFADFASGYNVGHQTRDFVLAALDTSQVRNLAVMPSPSTTWEDIRGLWPGRLPHVIVHVNAGSQSRSGSYIGAIVDSAVARHIGVVFIGDDAPALVTRAFGLDGVLNVPPPMGGAQSLDSLWIGLNRTEDDSLHPLVRAFGVNGIIANAVDSLDAGSRLLFKPYCTDNSLTCRGESDADKYTVPYPGKLRYLGYQRGWDRGAYVGDVGEMSVIVAVQDTIYNDSTDSTDCTVRRGVALSYQPQYLANHQASQQIVYDAVMYASLSHVLVGNEEAHLYDDIRIGVQADGEFTEILSIEMDEGQNTTLWVQGKRADNQQWEYVNASWWAEQIALEPPSGMGSSWQVIPQQAGEGWIGAATTQTPAGTALSARVPVSVTGSTGERVLDRAQISHRVCYVRVGSERFAAPLEARAAHVEVFSSDGRCLGRWTEQLGPSREHKDVRLPTQPSAACVIVSVRFIGREGAMTCRTASMVIGPE